jgi:hypothetical protein
MGVVAQAQKEFVAQTQDFEPLLDWHMFRGET